MSSKPRVVVLTTGGTIAMREAMPGAGATLASAADCLRLAPAFLAEDLAEIEIREVFAMPSTSLRWADLLHLRSAVLEATMRGNAIVITHGTDTLEETAFFLTLSVCGETPVVMTGAMRCSDHASADGPSNVSAAIRVAIHPDAKGKGILVVFDDEIHAGVFARKVHAFRTHAFSSSQFSPLGWVVEGRVRFFLRSALNLPLLTPGRRGVVIPILEVGTAFERRILDVVGGADIDGLVLSLPGGGHMGAHCMDALREVAREVPVVFATRTGGGETLRDTYGYGGSERELLAAGAIGAGFLDARKARIALMILISGGTSANAITSFFEAL
jgi:L-asparaginase